MGPACGRGDTLFGLDELVAELAHGQALVLVLAVALLLGLRHASDPDHLAAVCTLIATEPDEGARRAARLGISWGLGHATTLALFGLPIVLFGAYLPDAAQRTAEVLVGLIIMLLALRLLLRWQARLRRSPSEAFGIGLVHGVGGSAGVGVLLLAAIPAPAEAVGALLVLALGTAVSMAAMSSAIGYAVGRGPILRRAVAFGPAMGALTFAFGAWYTLGAAGVG